MEIKISAALTSFVFSGTPFSASQASSYIAVAPVQEQSAEQI
jgi:hypothetical protein